MAIVREIEWNKVLKIRNRLQQNCLKNKHSYSEEIKINVPDGLIIEIVIGGRTHGNVDCSYIYPYHDFFLRIHDHFIQAMESYDLYHHKIPKDLK